METVNCIICNSTKSKFRFDKSGKHGEKFTLVQCTCCGLEYVNPRPTSEEIGTYYTADYFTTRTERGYNNYFSEEIRTEIERVISLNLKDLGFYTFEKILSQSKVSLDIGCAAGYFVNYLYNRGWRSQGIDVSKECVDFAQSNNLSVTQGDYLEQKYKQQFDLITLWASIEHLHTPHLFLKKVHTELSDNGRLYISTCRVGSSFAKLFGKAWRFYNFPEHLYFFSYSTIKRLLKNTGFSIVTFKTYGSGIGRGGTFKRKLFDFLAKRLYLGDMMIICAVKQTGKNTISNSQS